MPSCQERGGELGEARLLSGDAYLVGIGGGGQWVHFAIYLKDHSGHAAQAVAVDVKLKNRGREVLLEGLWVRSDCQRKSEEVRSDCQRKSQAGPLALHWSRAEGRICYSEDPREVLGSQGSHTDGDHLSSSPGTDTSGTQGWRQGGVGLDVSLQAQPELPKTLGALS